MKKFLITLILCIYSIPLSAIQPDDIDEIIKSISSQNTENNKNSSDQIKALPPSAGKKGKQKMSSFPPPDEELLKNAIDLYEASLYPVARQKFEELRSKYPDSPYRDISSIWLSKIYVRQGNYDESVKILNSINPESGEYPRAMFSIAEINLKKGDDTGAIEYFYKSASFPDNAIADDALMQIAGLYLKNNNGNQAMETLVKIIKNYGDRETIDDAYFMLAQVYEKDAVLKDFGIAKRLYKIFLKKADMEKAPFFENSPLKETVIKNLSRIENTYYSKGFSN